MSEELRHLIARRLRKYRDENGLSREEMAEQLGIKAPNYGNIERGEQLPTIQSLQQLARISDIPYSYWIDGIKVKPKKTKAQEDAAQADGNFTLWAPVVNQYAYAGYLSGYADAEYIDKLPKIPWMVDREHKGNYITFEVRNDSMDDGTDRSYKPGDKVLGREIARHHWQNKLHIHKWVFVIVHKTDGIILKEITEHDTTTGRIQLHSLNPLYEDKWVNLDEVAQLFNVVQLARVTKG